MTETRALTIAVVGASRNTGLAVARLALERGHTVRTVSRTRPDLTHSRLRVLLGDARDENLLAEAVQGADVAISALGVTTMMRRTTVLSETTAALVAALQKTGVRRLVAVTGFGAGDSRGRAGFAMDRLILPMLGGLYADKDRQEALIRDSGLDWTLVRPGLLTNQPGTGAVARTTPQTYEFGRVSREDVAAFLLERAEQHDFVGQTPTLTSAA